MATTYTDVIDRLEDELILEENSAKVTVKPENEEQAIEIIKEHGMRVEEVDSRRGDPYVDILFTY